MLSKFLRYTILTVHITDYEHEDCEFSMLHLSDNASLYRFNMKRLEYGLYICL